jgi:hypothetical protein
MTPRFAAAIVCSFLTIGALAAAQEAAPRVPERPPVPPEAAQIAQGWTRLAQGDSAGAATIASGLLTQYPGNVSALALAIEADVMRAGAMAALDTYERWLGARKLDDGYALRRVARAALREAVFSHSAGAARILGLKALAADGDPESRAELEKAALGGNAQEATILASIGDVRAVNILIAQLNTAQGNKDRQIAALGESRSNLAVKALITLLSDPNDINRAAAADALGKLGATQAINPLKSLLDDKFFPVHLKAAGALYRLGDMSGIAFLTELQGSEHAGLRLAAVEEMSSNPDAAWQNLVRNLTQDRQPEIRARAAQLIAPYDPDLAKATLEVVLGDENAAVRELAANVYAQHVAGDFATLRRFLRSTDPMIRAEAASRILELTR